MTEPTVRTVVRTVARDRLLATALVLFAIGSFFGILKYSDLDLPYWESVHYDATETFPPGEVWTAPSGYTWDTTQFDPFAGPGLGLNELVLLAVFYGSTFVIGDRILRSFEITASWSRPLRLGAGFLVAYVPIIVVVRLVTLRVDLKLAPWLCLVSMGVVATRILLQDRRGRSVGATTGVRAATGIGAVTARRRRAALGVVAAYAAIAVWTYQSGRNFLVSDSIIGFLRIIRDQPFEYLPRFGKQSDEFLYNSVPVYALRSSHTYALWFWLTNAFGKASMACLLYGTSRTLCRGRRFPAVLSVCLVLFATPVADPRFYTSLFGGQNPTIFLGHIGRFLGIVLPLLVAGALTRKGRWSVMSACVLGMAVATTSVHLLVFAVFTTGFLVVLALADHRLARPLLSRVSDSVTTRLMLVAVLSPLLAYAYIGTPEAGGLRGYPLVAGGLAAFAAAAMVAAAQGKDNPPGPLSRPVRTAPVLGLGVGILIGAVAAGGSTDLGSLERLGPFGRLLNRLLPAFGETVLYEDTLSMDFDLFSATDCTHGVAVHCRTFEGFVGYYGTTFLLLVLMWAALRRSTANPLIQRRDTLLFLYGLAALTLGFFLTDFVGPTGTTVYWTLTRFIEVGYYLLLALAPVVFWNHLGGRVRATALALLGLWVGIPFVSHSFLAQWAWNLRDLATNVL